MRDKHLLQLQRLDINRCEQKNMILLCATLLAINMLRDAMIARHDNTPCDFAL